MDTECRRSELLTAACEIQALGARTSSSNVYLRHRIQPLGMVSAAVFKGPGIRLFEGQIEDIPNCQFDRYGIVN